MKTTVELPTITVGDKDKPADVFKKWQKSYFVRGRMVYLNKRREICQFIVFFKGNQARVVLDAGRGVIAIVPRSQIEDANIPRVTTLTLTEVNQGGII